ncbi:MAG: ABC transporter permease [Acidobacteriaceae bacterium]|nr:ABC transporter permease [Acidobacteriaceae bacterium]MBV9780980.1 ABC transporter permease [Acidobacteriaceae bacterium]
MSTHLVDDVRVSVRSLRKAPGFTTVAVLAVALGIGANAAIFSAVNALLLGPMPYSHPEELVMVWEDASAIGFPHNNPAVANYLDWRRMNHVFTDLAIVRFRVANLTGEERPEMVLGRGVSANLFAVLGARPLLGRTFTSREDSTAAKVVVIGYGLWQHWLGGARDVIGRTIRMNGEPITVIGVMPKAFAFPDRQFQYWEPIHLTPEQLANRDMHSYDVVARLRPGITVGEAQADMSRIAGQLEREYPDTNGTHGAVVVPLRKELVGDTRTALLILMLAAALVLLIACANVANLLLTRGAKRNRELALRTALGATRIRLIRQLVAESLLLSAAGVAAGLVFAFAGMNGLQALIPEDLVNSTALSINVPVLLFAIMVSFISGVVFGFLPALASSRIDVNESLKQGGRTVAGATSRLKDGFVVSQVALALVLVSGAGLLIETLSNMRAVDMGFPTDHLLTMVTTRSPEKSDTDAKTLSFTNQVILRISQLPGVRSADFASDLPFTSIGDTDGFVIQGRAPSPQDQLNDALYREVTSHYLQTLGVHLLSGRLLDERDTPQAPRALVINQTFARRYWRHENPIGAHLRVGGEKEPWRTVVGVIADVKERGLQLEMKPAVYLPFAQVHHPDANYLLVRTAMDPKSLASEVQNAIWSVDPEQPISLVRTMDEYARLEMRDRAHQMEIFTIFAGLALFLAALGIYGVLAYAVTQRKREIGIRMALGADAVRVTSLVVRHGLMLTAIGLGIGLLLSAVSAQAIRALLFGVQPWNAGVFSTSGIVLVTAALAACVVPAFTASRVDPIIALRDE